MTPGHVLVTAADQPLYRLYTSHDGHAADVIQDLAQMPFLLHEQSSHCAMRAHACRHGASPDFRFNGGPYHMQVLLAGTADNKYKTVDDIRHAFRCGRVLELYTNKLAHWLSQCWFDRWYVVRSRAECHYVPDPDVSVRIADGRDAYVITSSRLLSDLESFAEVEAALSQVLVEQSAHLPPEAHVVFDMRAGEITVPFTEILVQAAWRVVSGLSGRRYPTGLANQQSPRAISGEGEGDGR